VIDQLRLWQLERDRLRTHSAALIDSFTSRLDFDRTLAYARGLGCVLWEDPEASMGGGMGGKRFVVAEWGVERVRDFVKRAASNAVSGGQAGYQ
jgi:hypothetical protein